MPHSLLSYITFCRSENMKWMWPMHVYCFAICCLNVLFNGTRIELVNNTAQCVTHVCVYSEMLRTEKANEAALCDNAQRSFDDFSIVSSVGKGTYGQLYKAVDTATRQ